LILTAALLSCTTPTSPLPSTAFPDTCRGIGLDATLFGKVDDPRITWLMTKDGVRRELVWPPHYAARFNPDLEVLNEQAAVVFRQGDIVRGGCVQGG
jgi:hypothetical protein